MSYVAAQTQQATAAPQAPGMGLPATAQFFEMLGALTRAGIPVVRALDSLSGQPELSRPLWHTVKALESGHTLSRAFAIGGFSDPMVLNLIQLGERTGTLDRVIGELATLFRWRAQLRAELKSRLTYPAILALSCALLVGLGPPLLLKPILDFLAQTGGQLSGATLALLAFVKVLSSPWFWLSAPLALWSLRATAVGLCRRSPARVERWTMAQPVVGPCLRLLYSVRFGRALLSGLGSGFPLLAGLELAARCSGSAVLREQGEAACNSLIAGDTPEQAFAQLESLDPLLRQSIPLGMSLGSVETLLGAVLRLSEERLRHNIDQVLALLEPILLGFMGALVGFCILGTVSPMMSLLQGVM